MKRCNGEWVEARDLAALERLAPRWQALWRRCPWATPFQHPAWLIPWWRHLGEGRLCSLALGDGERLALLAPLYIYQSSPGAPRGMFTAHRAIFRKAFARHQRGTNLMLVADMQGYPVGQVWIDFACQKQSGAGMVWALRVMPWLQNQGLGASLMQAAEAAIARRGLTRVALEVERRNTHARRFYARLGYRSAGWRNGVDSYEWNGRTIHRRVRLELMTKELVSCEVGAEAMRMPAAPAGRACALAVS